MATPKKAVEKKATKPRATADKLLQLALALRAILDAFDGPADTPEENSINALAARDAGLAILNELGFGSLIGIPKQVAVLTVQLEAALNAGDGARLAELGKQLALVKSGKLQIALPLDQPKPKVFNSPSE